jgi:hypothetical protein
VSAASGPLGAGLRSGRPFVPEGVSFAAAGAVVAVWNATERFPHGWWLVSFLMLVGGVAQLLFGAGRAALGPAALGITAAWWDLRAQAALWNAGTLLVALGVMAGTRLCVVAGTVLLLCALAAMGAELRARRDVTPRGGAWQGAYVALLVFLATSALVGAALAWDLAWV